MQGLWLLTYCMLIFVRPVALYFSDLATPRESPRNWVSKVCARAHRGSGHYFFSALGREISAIPRLRGRSVAGTSNVPRPEDAYNR